MSCIKTGAIVYFSNYGFKCSADVFRVNDCIVVRTHPGQVENRTGEVDNDRVDMEIYCPANGDEFWRTDIGVFVVPENHVRYYTNAAWTQR